jgi:hypothetical protein
MSRSIVKRLVGGNLDFIRQVASAKLSIVIDRDLPAQGCHR